MKSSKRKKLIVNLIINDLVNNKLVSGLQALGIDASGYYLDLSNCIFELMGFPKEAYTEELYDRYNTLMAKVFQIDFDGSAHKALEPLAMEILRRLEEALGRYKWNM